MICIVPKANLYASATQQPDAPLKYSSRKRLSVKQWDVLAESLMGGVEAALGDRQPLDQNLNDWNDLYEMMVEDSGKGQWPWEGAANVFVPIIPTSLEGLLAYISAQVLVPSLFMVTGNNAQASDVAHLIERYYNSEYKKQRGTTSWFNEFLEWLHLGLRDGTGYIEALWKYKVTKKRIDQSAPKMQPDPETGVLAPVLDDQGKPIYEVTESEVEDVYNDVDLRAVELRNIITIPASATSIEEAVAVIKVEYLMEDQLMELVHDGVLDEEEVEKALDMVPTGTTELPTSPQPTGTYTQGQQVGIDGGQGSQTSEFFKNRGPIEVYRIHSRQYDLDNDGTPEENVFWVHRSTRRMLGWMRYQYFNGLRPFFPFSPFPRPKRVDGFALPERLAGLQNEANATTNTRLDYGSRRITAPGIVKKDSALADNDMSWAPNVTWESENPQDDYQVVQLPQVPGEAFIEVDKIKQDVNEYTGMSMPMMGAQSSARRSATEAKQQSAAAMTRTGLLAMRYRISIRTVVNFVHALKKQYLTADQSFVSQNQEQTISPEQLNADVTIDVSGASDPIDAAQRRTETIGFVQTIMQIFGPALFQDYMKQWRLARKLFEAMNWDQDVEQILGTEQQAQQTAQQMQQMQQMQAMMQAAGGQPPNGAAKK